MWATILKLNKYEKRYVRMMIIIGSTIAAITLSLKMLGTENELIFIIFIGMMIIFYLFKMSYWNYLEKAEIMEMAKRP